MKRLYKIITAILDIIELYIPMVLFSIVFVMYLIMIFYRYIFMKQVSELYEASLLLYMACAMLAACYIGRSGKHVVFPILYEACGVKVQKVMRMIADLIVIAISGVLLVPTWESLLSVSRKKSELLHVPFSLVYTPFMIFIVLTMLYYLANLIKEIKSLAKKDAPTKFSEGT